MPTINVPIVRGDKTNSNTDYADKLPKNMIAVAKEIRGAAGYLVSADGLLQHASGIGIDRGAFYNDRQSVMYRLSGERLIKLSAAGAVTNIGTIPGSGRASMAYSFNSQMIVADGSAYLSNGSVITKITDPDLGSPLDVCWIDGYFFYTDGEFIYHSLITDESQVDPLQFATAEFMPDKSIGVLHTQDNLVMVLGRYSIEYFINQANPQFAFSRIVQKSIKGGIVGTHCKCELGGRIFILGGRRDESSAVHLVQAGSLQKLSTQTVDEIISGYTEDQLSTAVLEGRTDERDILLIVRLPNHTLVLNYSAIQLVGIQNAWSVLSYGIDNGKWLGANGVYDPRISKWVYGSVIDGRIFTLDKSSAAQGGEPAEWEFSTPLIPVSRARIGKIELNTIPGYNAEQIDMFLSVSKQGAFESSEYVQIYSGPLQYDRGMIFRRCVGFVDSQFSLNFRGVSKDKVNVSNLVIDYV